MDPKTAYEAIRTEVAKQITGNEEAIELMFIALLANGHALLEGVPGVAKTTMAKALAETINVDFKRIQGTPDLEPKDIIGYTYLDGNEIKIAKGPIFTNMLLVDELNRMQPKMMSALLETLAERQVTIGDTTMQLSRPFIAYATQNPLNIEGTVPLPKVLADRFMIRIEVGYVSQEDEKNMLRLKEQNSEYKIKHIINSDDVLQMQDAINKIKMPDEVANYVTKLVAATRSDIHVVMGASPRADIAFMQCGKARALIHGRDEVSIEDIKALAKPVLSHRIVVRATGGIGVKGIIDGLIATLNL
ncbi:MAG: MoxR family ATPase [Candidatus Micrarchaeaceae archaeon]